jgi:hypothetical protein
MGEDLHEMVARDRQVPAIYGELTDPEKVAYGRWIMALFDRAGHVDACPFGCRDDSYVCSEGRSYADAEQSAWQVWHAVRRSTRG